MSDLEKGKKPQQVLVQKTPHMIAHSERVRLFRRAVADEKVNIIFYRLIAKGDWPFLYLL